MRRDAVGGGRKILPRAKPQCAAAGGAHCSGTAAGGVFPAGLYDTEPAVSGQQLPEYSAAESAFTIEDISYETHHWYSGRIGYRL